MKKIHQLTDLSAALNRKEYPAGSNWPRIVRWIHRLGDMRFPAALAAVLAFAPATRAVITLDGATTLSLGGGTNIYSWSHSVGTGANRMLVVAVTTESNQDRTVTNVTFGAQALTQVPGARTANNGGGATYNATDLWYLPAPAVGSSTITITLSGNVSGGLVAAAVSLFGAVQGPPEAVTNYNAEDVGGSTYSASITPLTDGAWLVDVVNNSTVGTAFTPVDPSQILRWSEPGVNHAAAGSTRETRLTTPPGAVTDSWTSTGTSRRALSVAAFAPVTIPPPAADIVAFGLPGLPAVIDQSLSTITWTLPHGTDVKTLAPTYTKTLGATCPKASGSPQDFTSPVHYVVTSSDTLTQHDYTVTVTLLPLIVTNTYNLGTRASPTTIQSGIGGLLPWITKGNLPTGSILRSVSVNAILESVAGGATDDWASDLCAYIDPSPEAPGTAALLQVGGYGTIGTVALALTDGNGTGWANGQNAAIGTVVNDTITAADWSSLGDIDLGTVQLSVGNDYSQAAFSGTITVEYYVTALGVVLISPAAAQGYLTGTSITATANVQEPGAFTDTVTFHTTPIAPAGPTVDTVSTNTTSPFTAVLGTLPAGSYEIYATVVNTDNPPGTATSVTNTFTVAAAIPTTTTLASSANPSTYGQNVTLTATVAPPPAGGTVQFYDGASALGSPVAVNTGTGEAQFSTSRLGAGTHDLTAAYSGYGLNVASTSDVLTQVVNKAEVTVKALNVLRAPNTANPDPLPYQLFGYQNGETLATSGVTGTPTLTTTAVRSSAVGTYDITCAVGSLAAANYSFTALVNGTLTVAVVGNIFGINFYVGPDWPYGGLTTDEQKANLLLGPSMPAGLGDWYATGWRNFLVPWAPAAPLAPVTLTSTRGSTATFIFNDCRNGWTYDGPRTTLLGDGNGNMMDGHVNSTLDPGDGSNLFDMQVTNIPFAAYDVIFYMGASQAQYGDGTGSIVFNGGTERAFTVQPGAFNGTFTEMVDEATPGNYIVYTGVTGSSFTTQTWGKGPTGFNHVGPFGFQIRDAVPTVLITGITGPDLSGKFTIAGATSASAKVGLFRSTAVNAPLAGVGWTQDGASQTGTSFSFTGTGGGAQAFFILKVVP